MSWIALFTFDNGYSAAIKPDFLRIRLGDIQFCIELLPSTSTNCINIYETLHDSGVSRKKVRPRIKVHNALGRTAGQQSTR